MVLCSYYKSRGRCQGNHSYQQTTMGNRRKLQNHEVRVRGKACVCQTEDRIKAHFLTCFISLLVYRLLEKKLGEQFTCNQILETLRNMNVTLYPKTVVTFHLINGQS